MLNKIGRVPQGLDEPLTYQQHKDVNLPLLSVGLPVFNRPKFLRLALASLVRQSYKNFEIIISDDYSPSMGTRDVIRDFAVNEPRIKYFRQKSNIGAVANHRFVFEKANGEFFFWASEDDEWDERYFETGIRTLLAKPHYDAWCSTIRNTDSFGRVIREYPGFSRWTSTQDKRKDVKNYLLEPGNMGKAHVFHSIFRMDALRKTVDAYWTPGVWGDDMCFSIAFLTRFNLIATDEVLFNKRVIRKDDNREKANPMPIMQPNRDTFPFYESATYIRECYKAAHLTPYKYLVLFTMLRRLPGSIRNYLLVKHDLKEVSLKLWRKVKILLLYLGNVLFLNELRWKRRFSYKFEPKAIDARWSSIDTHGLIQVPLDILLAPINTSGGKTLVAIEQTPHYRLVKSMIDGKDDKESINRYRDYLITYYSKEDAEAGIRHVIDLVDSVKEQEDDKLLTIITRAPKLYRGAYYAVIFDGLHRSAIAKALGHKSIQCRLVLVRTGNRELSSLEK